MPSFDESESYKDLGWENGWYTKPPELVLCEQLNHQKWSKDIGPLHMGLDHLVRCSICMIQYHYDSGD